MKYVPRPEGLHLELHRESVRTGLVALQQCASCAAFRHPPRWRCAQCHSNDYRFTPSSGLGIVHSTVVTHFAADPGWVDELPYVAAVVELDEGPRIIGELRDAHAPQMELGTRVRVRVEARGDDVAYFVVEPVDASVTR